MWQSVGGAVAVPDRPDRPGVVAVHVAGSVVLAGFVISESRSLSFSRVARADRVARGSFADGNAIDVYLADGRLVASLHTGHGDEVEHPLLELIGGRATPRDLLSLADGSVGLDEAFATPIAVGLTLRAG
jgi:hypothetical protein